MASSFHSQSESPFSFSSSSSSEEQNFIVKRLEEYGRSFMKAFDDYDSDDEGDGNINAVQNNSNHVEDSPEEVSNSSDPEEDKSCRENSGGNPAISRKDDAEITNLLSSFSTPKAKMKFHSNNSADISKSVQSGSYKKASAREYRLFMSPRVSDVLKESTPKKNISFNNPHIDDKEDKEEKELISVLSEFEKMEKEVKELGKTVMKETNIRKWQIEKLVELGAKPTKNNRKHIDAARRDKKKFEKINKEKEEEQIASGMLRVKGSGIERRKIEKAKRKRNEDSRGLKVSEGRFKNGILYVTPLKKTKKDFPEHNSSHRDFGFSGATKSGSGVKRGKKSKSKNGQKKKRKH